MGEEWARHDHDSKGTCMSFSPERYLSIDRETGAPFLYISVEGGNNMQIAKAMELDELRLRGDGTSNIKFDLVVVIYGRQMGPRDIAIYDGLKKPPFQWRLARPHSNDPFQWSFRNPDGFSLMRNSDPWWD